MSHLSLTHRVGVTNLPNCRIGRPMRRCRRPRPEGFKISNLCFNPIQKVNARSKDPNLGGWTKRLKFLQGLKNWKKVALNIGGIRRCKRFCSSSATATVLKFVGFLSLTQKLLIFATRFYINKSITDFKKSRRISVRLCVCFYLLMILMIISPIK